MQLTRLSSGGLIVTYRCSSQCAHCLYRSSSRRPSQYMSPGVVHSVAETLGALGCHSVHIGGGEPFLDPDALVAVVDAARQAGLAVEYVETNSSWYKDHESACALLARLRRAGLGTLLVSMSPMHAGFVPLARVQGVLRACRAVRMDVFPWIADFLPELEAFDGGTTHSLGTFIRAYGADYLARIPGRYWVHLGGRALVTFGRFQPRRPLGEVLRSQPGGCHALTRTDHFHIDLHGDYVPGLCPGLAIFREDLGAPLDPDRYPLLTALHARGVQGLYELGCSYGFQPAAAGYISACELCDALRRHLARVRDPDFAELRPREFYPGRP